MWWEPLFEDVWGMFMVLIDFGVERLRDVVLVYFVGVYWYWLFSFFDCELC